MGSINSGQRWKSGLGPKNFFIVGTFFISLFLLLCLPILYSLLPPIKSKLQLFYLIAVLIVSGVLIYGEVLLVRDYLEINPT